MENAKINGFQLFTLMMFSLLGTSLVIGVGLDAAKDVWIAILLGLLGGLLLYSLYYFLYKNYPDVPFTSYSKELLGPYISLPINLYFVLYLLYIATRNLRDFGDLLLTAVLTETPLFIVNLLMAVSVMYIIYLGIEVIARSSEIFFFTVMLFGLTSVTLLYFSGDIQLMNLLPVLEDGWGPVLKTVFPTTIIFPFGEIVAFTILLPYLNKREQALKVGIGALILSGLILVVNNTMFIAVLGVDIAQRTTFPLITVISVINIADFLQRLDAIVVLTLIKGGFFKLSIYIYAALVGIADIFKLASHKKLLYPITGLILLSSLMIASDFPEHLEEGLLMINWFHIPMQIVIPLILALIVIYKNWKKGVKTS
ncbi:hypothetical protein BKP37_15625 [Anaerobacillus alkalilacustris]|uniref:Uncharacterized protein n=1 Tax=Anaerobacillus alkalilacustris TaxID=393763 RepID=A0A1S2LIF4_9BACI|nr:GerAB/ArcD/ProY family transporter [Anaerobacillus alkalilacustris]OIJ11467.1 hypothetical protein BKP37_15625 [Anaerobacillus alkalilacustris]